MSNVGNADAKNAAAVEAMQSQGWVWDGTAWCGTVSSGSNRRKLGEPVAWRRRWPNGEGGFHGWILSHLPYSASKLGDGEEEPLYTKGVS